MDLLTQNSSPRPAPERGRVLRAWAALAVVAACGGTTGMESVVGHDDASAGIGVDASSGGAAVSGDASVGIDASAGLDATISDGAALDRAVPGRPPARDAGVVVSPARDSGPRPEAGSAHRTTYSILRGISTDCLDYKPRDAGDETLVPMGCVVDSNCFDPGSMGGKCEDSDSGVMHLSAPLPSGNKCTDILGTEPVSEREVCLDVLEGIFSSKCAASQQETPCLCGTTDPTPCLAGTAIPTGPLYETYACDFNDTNGGKINGNFIVSLFGAGMANGIVQCIAGFGCGCCFGSPPDGGTCAPGAP